ncbi:TIGR00730 family Rossman fold protein [Fulvimarina sp. 2208YS6-2-32]|uniref:Cytokinin riboside 5'-monophosphate phosphoribohydrolase n=1 Tax=Fulvimarina uroteuthidis TaxID=3098149 RepID=A0ABU5I6P5_9HYPH|nr:TIGR00730 family Rossman fold protein [Fulvimarina sp. 2208YS6-2-32]MDY8110484.1 TIGR00730 family Rossman fold protein [Fulvimarina sp. 2208YS6-2-32]
MTSIRTICVYCGSAKGRDPLYLDAARALGRDMAHAGIRLVYGGGTRGIMGAVSDGVIEAGGQVTGIIPRFLIDMEATESELKRLDELVVTEDMHERKHLMFQRSDAFVALPGGIGTLEELIEILTWGQLGRHQKPIVIANLNGFWDPLTALLDHMDEQGFIHRSQHVRPIVTRDIASILPEINRAHDLSSGVGRTEIIEKL